MEEQEDGEADDHTQAEETQDDRPTGDPEEVYRPYVLPQVSLPHVELPEPSPGEETPDQELSDKETASEEAGNTETPAESPQQGGEMQTGVPQEEAAGE